MSVSLVAAGGSNALALKLNTFGEEAFLDLAREAISSFQDNPPDPSRAYLDEDGR
jgi:hypothetical protein